MPHPPTGQTANPPAAGPVRIGVDVGGTFTDLVLADDAGGLRVLKVPSTPPDFQRAVLHAIGRALGEGAGENWPRVDADERGSEEKKNQSISSSDPGSSASMRGNTSFAARGAARVVHGSTVATNALLQRAGEPVAFITTEGFRDMLLIGRQNRPNLYALRVTRPQPITARENWFTVRERIGASGEVVEALREDDVDRLVDQIRGRGLRHAAVCLLFSFVNPVHERRLGERLVQAGITVSLSCDVLPEFREYERASTTAINAALRPTVQTYLHALQSGLPQSIGSLEIMHSGGGTFSAADAAAKAAQLVLSGPAGGVIGAAYVAAQAGFSDVITYDMGGTSTDVATIPGGKPQWTTATKVDGLPIGLPMFDIHTVGAGGGSVAFLDAGGALRVGPRSAGANPGPASYARGGTEPTVTDANLVLGRILPDAFLGGSMRLDADLANQAIAPLAAAMGKTVIEAALGIVTVAEGNMAHAIRAVTARRGHDPRRFTLVTFGGAGGLHACALAEALDVPRVLVPPYCGVLSALGMVVAAPVADVSQTVVHLGDQLDDARIAAECGRLNLLASQQLPNDRTAAVEVYADVRFRGQSHEIQVRVERPQMAAIEAAFRESYEREYGRCPEGRAVELVTLRLRRIGEAPALSLPVVAPAASTNRSVSLVNPAGETVRATALERGALVGKSVPGPLLLVDPEATTFVPEHWTATGHERGWVLLEQRSAVPR
jgi:N-methylhydantoinase A